MVDYLRAGYEVSTRQACRVVQLARRSYYYQSTADPQTALRIRLHVLLRWEGWMINPKRVYRLYCEEGLGLRTKTPRRRRSVALRISLPEPTGPNQIWSINFVSEELGFGHRFRVLTLVDHFSRVSPALEVGFRMSGQRVADVLDRLSMTAGVPAAIRVDNVPEFTSKALDQWAYRNSVHLDFISPGRPVENAFIESFNASPRKECLNSPWFQTLDEPKLTIEQWRKEYNRVSPHSSFGNMTPRECPGQSLADLIFATRSP